MTPPPLLLGAGGSALAAARLLRAQGKSGGVVATETLPAASVLDEFHALGFRVQTSLPSLAEGPVVVSPGFAVDHPWMQALRQRGAKLLPEFALGVEALNGKILAITGSLGKTSMVLLAADLLRAAGKRVTVSGNIGKAVCEIARTEPEADVHVLELSSFQLEICEGFRPAAALCLNLFPNHLDRHGSLENYARAKARLFASQTTEDVACWPERYPVAVKSPAHRVFPRLDSLRALEGTPFASGALRENLAALLCVLEPLGLPPDPEGVIRAFRFPPFRMQELEIPGAGRVINDSKSTCLTATCAALSALPGHVHLIVGGLPKAEELQGPGALFASREISLYLMGRSAAAMERAWGGQLPYCRNHGDLSGCLHAIWTRRKCGEPLLFSPGCASFDQYSGYTERGTHFQRLVEALAAQQPMQSDPVPENL